MQLTASNDIHSKKNVRHLAGNAYQSGNSKAIERNRTKVYIYKVHPKSVRTIGRLSQYSRYRFKCQFIYNGRCNACSRCTSIPEALHRHHLAGLRVLDYDIRYEQSF